MATGPWIVKLGGSLAESATLGTWLELLQRHGSGRCVVVPGGGSFADAVRASQRQWGYSDDVAHHMALLAMVQYGLMLSGIAPALTPVNNEQAIRGAIAEGNIPVWLPVPMAQEDDAIEQSWRITSDSLAVWLARRLKASRVALIKSIRPPADTVADLRDGGIIDPCCADYAADDISLCVFGPDDGALLASRLSESSDRSLLGQA